MKQRFVVLRGAVIVLLLSLAMTACGAFDNAQQERQSQNEEITRGAQLGRVVMAEGIGERNAPIGETNTFDSSQDYIYVVAEAERIEEGTTMFARWFRDGQPFEDSSELTADRTYENTYVEFHLETLQDRMEEGEYSVQLFVNGNPAETAEFTVQ